MRGADDDDVLRDDGRRVQADLALDQIHRLVVIELQIDDAVLAERRDRRAGLRVEREHLIAGRHVDDALSSRPSVQYARPRPDSLRGAIRRAGPRLPVHPQQLAGRRVERDDRAARAGGHVDRRR